ncbi:MAG: DNA primase noncatalytic subunit PriX [Candidatus Micrarchaeaceae archaeon]
MEGIAGIDAMAIENDAIEFAYRYPFSEEAKKLVESLGISKIDPEHLKLGAIEVENALKGENLKYTRTSYNEIKSAYVIGYAYARMIASALGLYAVKKLAASEAERSYTAIIEDTEENILHLSEELGVQISESGYKHASFKMPFYEYINISKYDDSLSLVHQMLLGGQVIFDRYTAAKLLRVRIRQKLLENMPIPQKNIPKEVVSASKTISRAAIEAAIGPMPTPSAPSGRYAWIERLLNTPLPDFRHRIVNIVLAPYLVNVKGLSEEQAADVISKYIERCKELNPNTNITESYIRYQCSYSKKRGLRPLSFKRAKELLGEMFGDSNG